MDIMRNKNAFVCALGIITSFFSYQSKATLIDKDWNTINDSALLLDTTTGLQWLDLSVTANQSYNEMQTHIQQGGAYGGFRYATRDEVLHLWSEANITDTSFTWVINGEWQNIKNLADRLGTSILLDPHGIGTHALGMVEGELQLPANERRVMEISYHSNGEEVRTSSNYYVLDVGYANDHYSSYLVKALADGDLAPLGNPDGNINAGDMLIAVRIGLGELTPGVLELAHGDMNADGAINLSDIVVIINIVLSQ